ncbi:hypothetical protein HAX54_027472, partial [Datura stramonium]|nr:hypothetical protein [Datura stramonium]
MAGELIRISSIYSIDNAHCPPQSRTNVDISTSSDGVSPSQPPPPSTTPPPTLPPT